MEYVCKNCNHWEPQAAVVANKEDFGECNKLSQNQPDIKEDYIIPVLDGGRVSSSGSNNVEFITDATFGCNQFTNS